MTNEMAHQCSPPNKTHNPCVFYLDAGHKHCWKQCLCPAWLQHLLCNWLCVSRPPNCTMMCTKSLLPSTHHCGSQDLILVYMSPLWWDIDERDLLIVGAYGVDASSLQAFPLILAVEEVNLHDQCRLSLLSCTSQHHLHPSAFSNGKDPYRFMHLQWLASFFSIKVAAK